tara:strand:- start:15774 stop:16187 length:414 start_codon:yes stop_codon:yes gene_type:complete
MSTIVDNAKVQPSLVFDKLHVDEFTMRQNRANGIPTRSVTGKATRFALDGVGDKVYDSESLDVSVPDFAQVAAIQYILANPGATIETAMAAYMAEVAAVTTEMNLTGVSTFKLMAYFEAAIGRVYELSGDTGPTTMG